LHADLHADLDAADRARKLDGDGEGGADGQQDTFDGDMAEAQDTRSAPERCMDATRLHLAALLDHNIVSSLMMAATFWALFMEDIRIATMPKSADAGMSVVDGIVFFLFFFELIIQSIARYAHAHSDIHHSIMRTVVFIH
jgi:hypothetical protein